MAHHTQRGNNTIDRGFLIRNNERWEAVEQHMPKICKGLTGVGGGGKVGMSPRNCLVKTVP